jgi:hypothetical protein
MSTQASANRAGAYVFPPALVQLMREQAAPSSEWLLDVTDDDLVLLFTTIFFAGLETHEGEHYPVSVAFLGHSHAEYVVSEGGGVDVPPLYRWKIMRFASPRPFASPELVKLAVAGGDRRIYSAVGVLDDGRLAITGLAREGCHTEADPFVRIVAPRPGCLSIRGGRDLAVEYERGIVVNVSENALFAAAPVRDALEAIARSAGLDDEVVGHYLDTVVLLVRETLAHGRGGIFIISPEEHPAVAESAPYRMLVDFSLGTLLRLAWRIRRKGGAQFGDLLRNAFLTEAERVVEELGRLTAIDGAVLLNRSLGLVSFGVILPVRPHVGVVDARLADAQGHFEEMDLGARGTRHRAGATYAAEHPGSVVFVASEDGQVSCLLRERTDTPLHVWRLMTGSMAHE